MTKLFPLIIIAFLCLRGQSQHTLSGFITDKSSGESLWGATVYDLKSKSGAATNNYGYYSFTVVEDTVHLRISYIGYQTQHVKFYVSENVQKSFELSGSVELDEVQIVEDAGTIQEQVRMSTIDLSMEAVNQLPVLLGERDILKTIQLLPGVQSGNEGTSGLYVRGGGPDQNLMLLDGVPVYNASHLFGFFSIFNADAIKSVKLIKAGFPANYGGRLSSVVDIRMKEGNSKKIHGEGGIGLISAHFTLEGPIIKDKTSFIISGRRTYIDILARPLIRSSIQDAQGTTGRVGYFFYDVNAKINHQFSEKHRIYLSGYFGNDKFYSEIEKDYNYGGTRSVSNADQGLKWGNAIVALRWNYLIGPKLFSNTTITFSKYNFDVKSLYREETYLNGNLENYDEFGGNYFSGIRDFSTKMDLNWMPVNNHTILFGGGATAHRFSPGVQNFKSGSSQTDQPIDTTLGSSDINAMEYWLYGEDEIKWGEKFTMNLGVHLSGFGVENTFYPSIQPRLSFRYLINKKLSVKASYAEMRQFLHLLSNTSIGLPTDLWLPPTQRIPPQFSRQFALGLAYGINSEYQISLEGYYKKMENLIAYKDGASFFTLGTDWQDLVEIGQGWSYGLEVFFEKKKGKTTGWVGYTLSWSNRQFENISFGEEFPYRYDRRHDISLAITHRFSERIDIGIVWVYGTGNAVTLALERYLSIDGTLYGGQTGYSEIEHIEKRNNYRMPAYHRLDVGVNFNKETKWGERTWSIGFYNLYNRNNPFYLYFDLDYKGDRHLYQVGLFPIIPSISYHFKF